MEKISEVIKELNLQESTKKEIIPVDNMENLLSHNDCPYCGGAGMLHPKKDGVIDYSSVIPCACIKDELEKQMNERLIKTCGLPPMADGMEFCKFKVYDKVKTAFESAKRVADTPGELTWLALLGGNDTGKTHLAVSACKAWLNKGIPAKYIFTSLLLDELRDGYKSVNSQDSYTQKFRYYCNVPLLLLDDYGVESSTKWVQEKMDTLIDYRFMNQLSLIVTSNLSLDEMPDRIRSRLVRHPKADIVSILAEPYILK